MSERAVKSTMAFECERDEHTTAYAPAQDTTGRIETQVQVSANAILSKDLVRE